MIKALAGNFKMNFFLSQILLFVLLSISSIGGIALTCLIGKIVCSNTLENRLNLAFQESLPDIRNGLFPELKTAPAQKEPAKQQHAH